MEDLYRAVKNMHKYFFVLSVNTFIRVVLALYENLGIYPASKDLVYIYLSLDPHWNAFYLRISWEQKEIWKLNWLSSLLFSRSLAFRDAMNIHEEKNVALIYWYRVLPSLETLRKYIQEQSLVFINQHNKTLWTCDYLLVWMLSKKLTRAKIQISIENTFTCVYLRLTISLSPMKI